MRTWHKLLIFILIILLCDAQRSNNTNVTEEEFEAILEQPRDLTTVRLTPHISGIRVESPITTKGKKGFLQYDSNGVTEVTPDTNVKFVIFGFWLERAKKIFFTFDVCLNPVITVPKDDFTEHNDKVIEFEVKFPESDEHYRICYLESGDDDSLDNTQAVDDYGTNVLSKQPPHGYYLPLPLQVIVIAIFLALSALFAGLNLGIMAITPHELQIILNSGSNTEREHAAIVLPVRQKGNYLLCTILLTNAFFNAAISLLIEDLINSLISIGLATFFIVIFAEIIPQSICRKKGLAVSAYTIWITKFFLIVNFPIAYPVGRLLDFVLGEETFVYNRDKLLQLMKIAPSWDKNEKLAEDLKIAIGAMEISDKRVKDVMTQIDDVFMVSDDTVLNHKNIAAIVRRGHTRIPVYTKSDRNQIISILFLKDLALLDPDDEFTVSTVCQYYKRKLRFVSENTQLHQMLHEFRAGDYHLAFVTSDNVIYEAEHEDENETPIIENHKPTQNGHIDHHVIEKVKITEFEPERDSNGSLEHHYKILGIITLEDIVEEILQAEIIDESDMILDNKYKTRRKFSSMYCDKPNGTTILGYDEPCKHTSQALANTTLSWLQNKHNIFSSDFCAPRALLGLIHKNMRRIDITQAAFHDTDQDVPEPVELYKAGQSSKRFIVIIEGRATIHFTQSNMKFPVGPWESFGEEILKMIELHISAGKFKDPVKTIMAEESELLKSIEFIPDYDLIVSGQCKYLQVTVSAYLNAYKVTGIATTFKELANTKERENQIISTKERDRSRNRVEYIKSRAVKSMESDM